MNAVAGTQMEERVKIVFELERDEDGYPPFESEAVWAVALPTGNYRIDNIPFYAYDLALGDVVKATEDPTNRLLRFDAIMEVSSNNTIRMAIPEPGRMKAVQDELRKMGCESEVIGVEGLISVNIPGERLVEAIAFVEQGADADIWGWEEGVIRA